MSPAVKETPFAAPASISIAYAKAETPQRLGSFGTPPLKVVPAAATESGTLISGTSSRSPPFEVGITACCTPVMSSAGVVAPSEFPRSSVTL